MAVHTERRLAAALAIAAALVGARPALGQETAPAPAVRAVLFYSPTCPHCHQVMSVDLPPLVARYGDRLRLLAVNVGTPEGRDAYLRMAEHYVLRQDRRGVPTLVMADSILVGSAEIPEHFARLIDAGLAAGGTDWPDVPAIRRLVERQDPPAPAAARDTTARVRSSR